MQNKNKSHGSDNKAIGKLAQDIARGLFQGKGLKRYREKASELGLINIKKGRLYANKKNVS